MKKLWLFIFCILALWACDSEVPPEPVSPGAPIGKATEIYAGYAPPVDVFENEKPVFYLCPLYNG